MIPLGVVHIVRIKSNRHRLHHLLNPHAQHHHQVRQAIRNTFPANHLNRLCRLLHRQSHHRKVVQSINHRRPNIAQNQILVVNQLESFHRRYRMVVVAVERVV